MRRMNRAVRTWDSGELYPIGVSRWMKTCPWGRKKVSSCFHQVWIPSSSSLLGKSGGIRKYRMGGNFGGGGNKKKKVRDGRGDRSRDSFERGCLDLLLLLRCR